MSAIDGEACPSADPQSEHDGWEPQWHEGPVFYSGLIDICDDPEGQRSRAQVEVITRVMDGRLEPVEIRIRAHRALDESYEPIPIDSALLRRVSLPDLVKTASKQNRDAIDHYVAQASGLRGKQFTAADLGYGEAYDNLGTARPGSRPGPPLTHGEDYYIRAAGIYLRALAAGQSPVRAVATELHISRSYASKVIYTSRHRYHLLPTTTPGRPRG